VVGVMSGNLYIYETEMLLLPCEYIFLLIKYTVHSLEYFLSYQLHTVLTQGKTIIFKDQLQLFVFPECAGRNYFKTVPSLKVQMIEGATWFDLM
jgi:hypothetical protein